MAKPPYVSAAPRQSVAGLSSSYHAEVAIGGYYQRNIVIPRRAWRRKRLARQVALRMW